MMILETSLVLAINEVFGLWSMLLVIIWVILIKIMDRTIPSIRDNIIMISAPFLIVISPLKIRIESRTADWLILLILNNKMIMLEPNYWHGLKI